MKAKLQTNTLVITRINIKPLNAQSQAAIWQKRSQLIWIAVHAMLGVR